MTCDVQIGDAIDNKLVVVVVVVGVIGDVGGDPSAPERCSRTATASTSTAAISMKCWAVAQFLRRTGEHSPVAYPGDKVANWGEQPLHVWRSVVKGEGVLAQMEEMLDVQAPH